MIRVSKRNIIGTVTASLIIACAAFSTALADEIDHEKVCGKMKQCVAEELTAQGITGEVQQSMMVIMEQQCAQLLPLEADKIKEANLTTQANACIDSMVALECGVLLGTTEASISQECKDFKSAADAAGVDIDRGQASEVSPGD